VKHPFPILRWVAIAFLAVWVPAYAVVWGSADFLYLCNVAVVFTCLGLWVGSPLLLSSQAVGTLIIGTLWAVDLAGYALTRGQLLIGGTEYMWDAQYPLWVRLLSFDHVAVPVVALWATRRIGYDRRAWKFQSLVAAVVLICSRLVAPEMNLNFAQKELVTYHTWGPAPVHILFLWTVVILLVYWPVHAILSRAFPAPRDHWTAAEPSPPRPDES
jgi:hypothetical protein